MTACSRRRRRSSPPSGRASPATPWRRSREDIYARHGFDPRYAYIGHYVGLSVHDVGDWSLPFEAGMVMAIEPIIDLPDQQLHIRVEDTILVTPTGAEILTPGCRRKSTNSR